MATKRFQELIIKNAWWRAAQIDKSENCRGDFLENDKNCENCFFFDGAEDCANCLRSSVRIKDCVDCIDVCVDAELSSRVVVAADRIYAVKNSVFLINCQRLEYCAFCQNCSDCFACCGLVGKKFCILNREYSEVEYLENLKKMKEKMKETGEYGKFFPKDFSPVPYSESFAGFYWPLSDAEIVRLGFREKTKSEKKESEYLPLSEIPDSSRDANSELTQKVFWDEAIQKPLQIRSADISFAQNLGVPLPHSFYTQRLRDNFKWLFFDGELRKTKCAKTGIPIETTLPSFLDGRILSEEAYLQEIT